MNTLENKALTPHWLPRLFGAKKAILAISSAGLILKRKNAEPRKVLIEDLTRETAWHRGRLFSELALQTDRGTQRVKGLRASEVAGFFDWLRDYRHWLRDEQQLAPEVGQCAREIDDLLQAGYLRQSRYRKAKALAQDLLHRFRNIPAARYLDRAVHADLLLIQEVAHWTDRDVETFRGQYVDRVKERFAAYFDQVESNPLIESQRDACVIDEDNNLVLAGAGTGKTSTMVARAGFLIKSGQAAPDQILMLAFANKAAREMQERLDERVAEKGIVASTFHKLGMDIIASVENARPSISPLAEDSALLNKHVDLWFEEMQAEPRYRQQVLDYFGNYPYPEINPFDFETEGEYHEHISANEFRTFKGEQVKSLGECLIANRLFSLGVDYQYEADYEHETRGLDYRQYQPDFYLPEHGIYIEHFGIKRDGSTARFVDRQKYHSDMAWKRDLHEKHGTRLIETYSYEQFEGTLLTGLEEKLTRAGVSFDPVSPDEMLDTLREFGAIGALTQLLADLLRRYKSSLLGPGQLENIDSGPLQHTLKILLPLCEAYESFLAKDGHIDFDDMIGRALEYVETGRFVPPWRYILVDEFQDISGPRARLVNALKESADACSLFCVGDDWQSIYRFTGSDIRFTTEFEAKFGPTKITALDKTFRFNDSICDIASRFVLENPAQVKKSLTTQVTVQRPAVSLLREKKPRASDGDDRLHRVLKRIAEQDKESRSVYLLGRFHLNLPDAAEMRALRKRYPNLSIESNTIHGAKGLEADYVVVLGLERGKYGFPSQRMSHPLLEALLPAPDEFPHAEERRLFYVALTRAKQRVYLIVDMASASEFVTELLDEGYPLELDEFETSLTQKAAHLIRCVKCETGTLVARRGKSGVFYGCSHYPLCKHTENGCQKCGNPMQRVDRFKVCLDPACDSWVPLCPVCGAEMAQRRGRYGQFWGCKNYRGKNEGSCQHTEQHISFEARGERRGDGRGKTGEVRRETGDGRGKFRSCFKTLIA